MRSLSLRRAGIALGAVLGLGVLCGGAHASNVATGSEAPNVGGEWLNHDTTTLKDLRGMAVLIEFWGST